MLCLQMYDKWRWQLLLALPFRKFVRTVRTFSSLSTGKPAIPKVSDSMRKLYGDINIDHQQLIQKYQRAPFNLVTDVRVVKQGAGFLATLEWRWSAPNQTSSGSKQSMAVTTGVQCRRKWAIAEACKAMMEKQNMLISSGSVPTHCDSNKLQGELNDQIKVGNYSRACELLSTRLLDENVEYSFSYLQPVLSTLWSGVLGTHDMRSIASFLRIVSGLSKPIPASFFEYLLSQPVYLTNTRVGEYSLKALLQMANSIQLEVAPRGLAVTTRSDQTANQVRLWARWRALLAVEEQACVQSALEQQNEWGIPCEVVSAAFPLMTLNVDTSMMETVGLVDSVLRLVSVEDESKSLLGLVKSVKQPSSEVACITVEFLTSEGKTAPMNTVLFSKNLRCVKLLESRINFNRLVDALREFYQVSAVPDPSHNFSPGLVDLLMGRGGSCSHEPHQPLQPGTPSPPIPSLPPSLTLSPSQRTAVAAAVSSPLSLVHGPPGTGKTHTLCGIIIAWRSENPWKQILACADSNAAADNIYRALCRNGVECFRLIRSGPSGLESAAPALIEEHVLSKLTNRGLVAKYRKAAKQPTFPPDMLWLKRAIEQEAVREFSVIVTTLSSSRHNLLDKQEFSRVIVDEAGQTLEPSVFMAISHGCEQLVLVGDHKQLPPVVLSQMAAEKGLSVSLFERLIEEGSSVVTTEKESLALEEGEDKSAPSSGESRFAPPCTLLSEQRRMHPSIAAFSNAVFYDGKIINKIDDSSGSLVLSEPPSVKSPLHHIFTHPSRRVMFIDTDALGGEEELVGTSTRNRSETALVGKVLALLVNVHKLDPSQIGVIVPYLAQKTHLFSELSARTSCPTAQIQVNTVDGFQGQEKEFIVISTVRCNVRGTLGFLEDDQRMNVMLTRAKKGVIVVGDKKTLSKRKNSRWKEWLHWVANNGHVIHARTIL